MKNEKIDLDEFFYEVRELPYVIVKLDDKFPNYNEGEDVDVFCYDIGEFAKKILSVGNKYLKKGFSIRVKNASKHHTYIDFCKGKEISFRFDVFDLMPDYKKIKIKKHYIYSVIENAVGKKRKWNGKDYEIYVPSEIDELLLRYVEFVEWYDQRQDKVKHLEYIVGKIKKKSDRISFIDKLHFYTELPEPNYDGWQSKMKIVPVFKALNKRARIRIGRIKRRLGGK